MAGMSLLLVRPPAPLRLAAARLLALSHGSKPVASLLHKQVQLLGRVSVRNSGHEKKMPMVPSHFEWNRFKDDLHFYLFLGFVPMLTFIMYVNTFIGPAEMSDIPEGYEPKEWEYHQHPIKRWFVKYVYDEPQKEYERTLHYINKHSQDRYVNLLEKKVSALQQDRQDYKGWYWIEVDKSVVDEEKAQKEYDLKVTKGSC